MNAITLKWEGIDLHANRDAWFNATEIAEAHGKRLDKFWEREETREYLDALCEILNTPKTGNLEKPFSLKDYPAFIKTRRGKYGGTWLHPDLMVCFARWISPRFSVWCDQTIKRLLTEQPQWQAARAESKTGAQVMAEILGLVQNAAYHTGEGRHGVSKP